MEIIGLTDFNLTDFLSRYMVYAFQPYTELLGSMTWGIIFGFVGAAIYVSSERQLLTVFIYLLVMALVFSIILPYAFVAIISIIITFIGTTIIYNTYVKVRE